MALFKDCKNLTLLHLQGTAVSDAGLTHFKEFKNLTHLTLQKTKVTAAGIDELIKALPKCKIEWDGGVIEPASDRKVLTDRTAAGGVGVFEQRPLSHWPTASPSRRLTNCPRRPSSCT